MAFRAPWAKLARLRSEARSAERDWLRSALQDFKRDAVRELAQAAGLRVRADDNVTWLSVGDLRAALLEHLAPARSAVPLELPWHLLLCLFVVLDETVKDLFNMSSGIEVRKSKLRKSNMQLRRRLLLGLVCFS